MVHYPNIVHLHILIRSQLNLCRMESLVIGVLLYKLASETINVSLFHSKLTQYFFWLRKKKFG